MIRTWIGLALLSASWLFGLDFYHDALWSAWAVLVVLGTLFLTDQCKFTNNRATWGVFCGIPAVYIAPWPWRIMPLLMILGMLLVKAPIPRDWPKRLGHTCILSSVLLLFQSLAVEVYTVLTARSHELPLGITKALAALVRYLGIQAAADGSTLAMHTMRAVHRLGATWELFLDIPTLCFLIGGIVLLILNQWNQKRPGHRKPNTMIVLIMCIVLWLPLRSLLLITVMMHRALRTEYAVEFDLMWMFWYPWVHLLLLIGPVLLARRFVHRPRINTVRSTGAAYVVCFLGVFLLGTGLLLDPPGPRKQGHVAVVEYHSQWERSDRPYDTEWYGHDSGYNYACIYDYSSRFYEMSRIDEPLTDQALAHIDVLMVKVPTERYTPEEIDAIMHFVQQGGGLMLMGEHTNVFNTGVYLNDIAGRFGFRFRDDCLFDIDTIFSQLYEPSLVAHPIIQAMGPLDFAVSCSIDPGHSRGQAVIRSTGLKSLPAYYHASNFYPQVEDRADVRYGAFIQCWAVRHGAGRVVAFSDSTIFSNFAAFEPGKAELMLGMLEWLNHRNGSDIRPWLIISGIVCLILALRWRKRVDPILVIALGWCAWSLAVVSVQATHHHFLSLPRAQQPYVHVVLDRTVCDNPLSKSGFIGGERDGFGIFERWILRLGYFTSRREGQACFVGDALVFAYPRRDVDQVFREQLMDYVASGGKVLILDSPANNGSTANALCYPFGLTVEHTNLGSGQIQTHNDWPEVQVETAAAVRGGQSLVFYQGTPVGAEAQHGKGTVVVLGIGSRFTDYRMGITGDVVPNPDQRQVFELEFEILQDLIDDSTTSPTKIINSR
jgi:hypothetical protein